MTYEGPYNGGLEWTWNDWIGLVVGIAFKHGLGSYNALL